MNNQKEEFGRRRIFYPPKFSWKEGRMVKISGQKTNSQVFKNGLEEPPGNLIPRETHFVLHTTTSNHPSIYI